jgi:hypothetical protein
MDAAAPGRFSADACVFVSANGGWNLLIGAAPDATGTWIPIEGARVPVECREVFGEVEKDRCFGRAGARWVMRDPVRWLGLLPAKLGGTFDGCGAASYYLHAANPREFGERAGRWLDVAETLWQRAVLLLGLVAVWRARPAAVPRGLATRGLAAVLVAAALAAVTRPAWIGYVGLCVAAGLVGRHLARHPPLWLAASVVGTTGLAHAVFFGAGRYSMVTFGLLGALAGTALAPRSRGLDGRGDAGARERAMF